MRIFDRNVDPFWESKVNFVDDNNVLVGYDKEIHCCELANWIISDSILKVGEEEADRLEFEKTQNQYSSEEQKLEGYQFDTSFFIEKDIEWGDGGSVVVFRLTKGDKEKFLHLINVQNGYYGHGFEFKIGDTTIREGRI